MVKSAIQLTRVAESTGARLASAVTISNHVHGHEQDGDEDEQARSGPRRYAAAESSPNRLAVDARDQSDRRIGAQGDEDDIREKECVKRHAEDVEECRRTGCRRALPASTAGR